MMYGQSITQPADALSPLKFESLCQVIGGKYASINEKIAELRRIKQIDARAYRTMKTQLPYFTIANFNPPVRRTENVAYADYLILDFDYLSNKQLSAEVLKKSFSTNEHVCLCFVSPGGDGLKVLFRLEPRIYDKNIFKTFYKIFAIEWCKLYNLEHIADLSACDITRATFMSVDTQYYVNNNALPLNYQQFINTESTLQFDNTLKTIKEHEKNIEVEKPKDTANDLTDEVLLTIKQKLNPNYKPPQKHIFVPQKLDEIIPVIQKALSENNLILSNVENIHYGKKLRIALGNRWAEINLFYGKKGFSLVKTPKNGSDGELCDVAYQFLKQVLEI